jgi:hypothetical protein
MSGSGFTESLSGSRHFAVSGSGSKTIAYAFSNPYKGRPGSSPTESSSNIKFLHFILSSVGGTTLASLGSEPYFKSESGSTDPIQSGSETLPLPSVIKCNDLNRSIWTYSVPTGTCFSPCSWRVIPKSRRRLSIPHTRFTLLNEKNETWPLVPSASLKGQKHEIVFWLNQTYLR